MNKNMNMVSAALNKKFENRIKRVDVLKDPITFELSKHVKVYTDGGLFQSDNQVVCTDGTYLIVQGIREKNEIVVFIKRVKHLGTVQHRLSVLTGIPISKEVSETSFEEEYNSTSSVEEFHVLVDWRDTQEAEKEILTVQASIDEKLADLFIALQNRDVKKIETIKLQLVDLRQKALQLEM